MRRLVLVLGDQLDHASAALDGFDPARDAILMSEAAEEATHVAQHKKRLVLFFAAMRHFAEDQRAEGRRVLYRRLDHGAPQTLAQSLRAAIAEHAPAEIVCVEPGDWRVRAALEKAGPVRWVEDRHFLSTPAEWLALREGRRRFILEDFYRVMRRRTGWLMDDAGEPVGGAWNFDAENRRSFGPDGPGFTPARPESPTDSITREVMRMVEARFPAAPGSTAGFAEPVTRAEALVHLRAFVAQRLAGFGDHQDAIAGGHRTLWHSRLSAAMNLKLIGPREVCEAALAAYDAGAAPLNAVEGFVRQILGWREFTRGVYFGLGPDYLDRNALGATADLPAFFWTGETDMACLRDAMEGLLAEGYAHHIQRLMVLGLFAMLWGANPRRVHDWHMGLYLDAIDWVSAPNVIGMSQHADGGVMGTKPYCASGAYIDRMSDRCRGCRYEPRLSTGPKACPFTTLYWDFLDRHAARLRPNMRMKMQLANLDRKRSEERAAIGAEAEALRERLV